MIYKANSLCWQCKRAYGFCSWSRDFIPVKGWTAKHTIIKSGKSADTIETDSYYVKKCPLFIQDRV